MNIHERGWDGNACAADGDLCHAVSLREYSGTAVRLLLPFCYDGNGNKHMPFVDSRVLRSGLIASSFFYPRSAILYLCRRWRRHGWRFSCSTVCCADRSGTGVPFSHFSPAVYYLLDAANCARTLAAWCAVSVLGAALRCRALHFFPYTPLQTLNHHRTAPFPSEARCLTHTPCVVGGTADAGPCSSLAAVATP
jgi:hypothetical protein